VGQVVHTLPEGEPVAGVTSLADENYSEVTAVVQESKSDATAFQGRVEGNLDLRSTEDKAEEQDKAKRKTNVIIRGLPEPRAADASDKDQEDFDAVQDLLRRISCGNISVASVIRLGQPRREADAQPRPIRADLASEDARNRVLRNAESVKGWRDGFWKGVFVHEDQTPKEREAHKKLEEELRRRRAAGEANLKILNGEIVMRSSEY